MHLSCPWRINRVPGLAALADIGWILHAVTLLLFNNGIPSEKGRFFTENEGLQAYTGYNDMQNRGPHGVAGVPLSIGNEGPPGVAILPDTRKNYPPKDDADSACLPSPPLASFVACSPVPRLAQHRPAKSSRGPHGKAQPLHPLPRLQSCGLRATGTGGKTEGRSPGPPPRSSRTRGSGLASRRTTTRGAPAQICNSRPRPWWSGDRRCASLHPTSCVRSMLHCLASLLHFPLI